MGGGGGGGGGGGVNAPSPLGRGLGRGSFALLLSRQTRTMKPLENCHILVTATSYGQHDAGLKSELEAAVGRVTYNETGRPLSSSQLAALLPGVDGYIAGLDSIDAVSYTHLTAADERSSVDLGGRRIIKKKNDKKKKKKQRESEVDTDPYKEE